MTIEIATGSGGGSTTTVEEVEEMPLAIPLSTFSTDGTNHRIDAQASTWNDSDSGGSLGRHTYLFSGLKHKLDMNAGSDNLTLIAGANATLNSDGGEKSIVGGSWNSYFYSQESFDPSTDFAITWDVTSTAGTIRQMIGLDDAPTANASYSSIDFAIYQVNATFYYVVYEKGRSQVTGKGSVTVADTDEFGIRCEEGMVTYFIQSGSTITDIYTSLNKATKPLFFKAAMNRGTDLSGHSVVSGCKSYTGTTAETVATRISGLATETINDDDANSLLTLGILPAANTTYSDFNFTRPVSTRFPAGLNLNYNHTYSVNETQDIQSVTL